jgi:hypothetical protein
MPVDLATSHKTHTHTHTHIHTHTHTHRAVWNVQLITLFGVGHTAYAENLTHQTNQNNKIIFFNTNVAKDTDYENSREAMNGKTLGT